MCRYVTLELLPSGFVQNLVRVSHCFNVCYMPTPLILLNFVTLIEMLLVKQHSQSVTSSLL
jgi:hypothetical protein